MTARHREIADFIQRFVDVNGYSPSFMEIQTSLGLRSQSTVHKHIHKMADLGLIRIGGSRQKRTLELARGVAKKIGCSTCEMLRQEIMDLRKQIRQLEASNERR